MSKGFLNSHSNRRCGLVWPNRMQAGILLPPNYARYAFSLTASLTLIEFGSSTHDVNLLPVFKCLLCR